MKERVGKLGTIALGASIALSACGGEKPTAKPTQLPTEKPTPTLVTQTPEASATPITTPTLEPTPTPTPEATPELFSIDKIVEGEHKAVKFDKAMESVENAYEQNPEAKTIYKYGLETAEACKTGENEPNPKFNRINREFACKSFVANFFKAYLKTGDINFYNGATNIYDYAISKDGLGKDYKTTLDEYLVKVGLLKK